MELKFNPDNPKYEYILDNESANKAIESLSKEKIIAIDVESTGLDPYLDEVLVVQVGTDEISYIFDVKYTGIKENEHFKKLLENPKILKLLQNAKFDYSMMKNNLGIEINNIYDTMLAEYVLFAGLNPNASLAYLSRKYTGVELEKAIRKTFEKLVPGQKLNKDQLEYGALDTLVLFPIFHQQWPKLQKEDLINIAKLEFAVTTVVGDMELNGIYIDQKRWREIIADLSEKRTKIAEEFQELIRPYYEVNQTDMFSSNGLSDAININSQVQLMDLFNNKLDLNLPSTGVGILQNVQHPVAKKLMEYRQYEKLVSAFGDSLLSKVNPITKRLHPNFQQLRTATGRFACNNPNLQQIPRNSAEAPFRECFNPEPGYKLVTADYSSMEMRILAELSGDENMIKAFNNGLDMHSFTAAMMFGKEYSDDFKKLYPDLRQAAKAIGFGLMYGMSAPGLAARLEVSRDVAEDYMKKYFNSFPSVEKFMNGLANNAVRKGWSATPAGRKRWYNKPNRTDPDYSRKIGSIQRQAKNHPIQGTNADAIKFALVFLKDKIRETGVDAKITHTVHDEIVCEVRNDQAEDWALVQSEEMVRAANLYIKSVPVVSEPFVGDVWEH